MNPWNITLMITHRVRKINIEIGRLELGYRYLWNYADKAPCRMKYIDIFWMINFDRKYNINDILMINKEIEHLR